MLKSYTQAVWDLLASWELAVEGEWFNFSYKIVDFEGQYLHELLEICVVEARLVSISGGDVKKVVVAGCHRFSVINISSGGKL